MEQPSRRGAKSTAVSSLAAEALPYSGSKADQGGVILEFDTGDSQMKKNTGRGMKGARTFSATARPQRARSEPARGNRSGIGRPIEIEEPQEQESGHEREDPTSVTEEDKLCTHQTTREYATRGRTITRGLNTQGANDGGAGATDVTAVYGGGRGWSQSCTQQDRPKEGQ